MVMRISSSVLISAIVILACLMLPPGIFAFSATGAANLKVVNDNHGAGIADKNAADQEVGKRELL